MRRLGLDRTLLSVVAGLLVFGLLILYSAGQTEVPSSAGGAWMRQLVWVGGGIVLAALTFRSSFRVLEWAAPGLYLFALALLVVVLIVGTGAGTAAGTKSWLAIGGVRLGQPVELAKLATILFLARYLSTQRSPPDSLRDMVVPCAIVGLPFLLVMAQPDLGSAIVFIGILFAMLFWVGARPSLLLLLASPLISLLLASQSVWWGAWMVLLFVLLLMWKPYVVEGVVIYLINSAMGVVAIMLWDKLRPHQQARLVSFLNPEAYAANSGYQAIQSKVAIGSGGLFGNGFTQGPQKRLAFLPEQHTDFIFSVVGEELGFVGVLAALLLFFGLFLAIIRIARRASDPFSSLVAFGILGFLFTHVFENVGMTISIMPITGIPLPFFSYGGSFLLTCALALGLLFRVAWDSRLSGYAEI
ncbi:MAG: rod shape-determining protein RodA [Gemmatimonadota bacterium]|nr:rod shape-determining protein RodA [Gemmatimonadota bacterium]